MPKQVSVTLPNRIDKKAWVKFEVDNARESNEPIKNIYVSKKELEAIGNPAEVEVIVRPKKES